MPFECLREQDLHAVKQRAFLSGQFNGFELSLLLVGLARASMRDEEMITAIGGALRRVGGYFGALKWLLRLPNEAMPCCFTAQHCSEGACFKQLVWVQGGCG